MSTVREQRAKRLVEAVADWMREQLGRTFETNELPGALRHEEWTDLKSRFLEILP